MNSGNKPGVVVGVYVFNKEGKIFLMRSPKCGGKLVIPGGKVEYFETVNDAVKREIKEETNLDITDIEFITYIEVIDSPDYLGSMRHFVGLDFKAVAINEKNVRVDGIEGVEYVWLAPEEIIAKDDVADATKEIVEKCLVKNKKSFFNRECKNCEKVNPVKSPQGGVSEAEFNRVKSEAEEYKIGWQRALADYQNLQKETLSRRAEWAQMSEQQILEEFIPVYENFKTAVSACLPLPEGESKRGWEQWMEGLQYIKKQFADIMKAHGVEEIKTVGEKFDPKYHEAVGHEATPGAGEDEIVREISGGFRMGERTIKAARVMVNKIENAKIKN